MASSELVDADIRAGRDVIAELVEAGIPLRTASWFHAPEFEDWRLMLATSLVRKEGPLAAYKRVTRVLARHESTEHFPLSQLWLVDDKDPRIDALSKYIRTTSGSEVRLTNCQVHGFFIPDALIYGLPRSA